MTAPASSGGPEPTEATSSEPTEEMRYRAGVDLEITALRMILLGTVGVIAADKNDVDKANGFVRRIEQIAKQALAQYPPQNELYKEQEFRRRTSEMISGMLDALSFGRSDQK